MEIIQGENALACIICGHKLLLHSDIIPFITLIPINKKEKRIPLQNYSVLSQNEISFSNGLISATLSAVNDEIIRISAPKNYDISLTLNLDKNDIITQNGIRLNDRYIIHKDSKPLKETSGSRIYSFLRNFLYLNVKKEHYYIGSTFDLGRYSIKLSCQPKSVDCTFKNSITILCPAGQPIQIQIVDSLSN